MLVYFSGETAAGKPEKVLNGRANLMLSFILIRRQRGKISGRFLDLHNFRTMKRKS